MTNEIKTGRIVIRHGEENRSRINSIYETEDIFYPSYLYAMDAVKRIVEAAEEYGRHKNERTLLSYTNNMILFTAERGGGKTSAMVSFGKALEKIDSKMEEETRGYWNNNVLNSRFYVLSSIDPTFMEDSDSILKILLSRMFSKFKEKFDWYVKEQKSGVIHHKKENLIELFQKCYKNIDVLQQNSGWENTYDDIYYLADLSDSTNLQSQLYELCARFLNFVYENETEEGQYIVIQIDDVDLNAKRVYDLLEDLRKYAMLPNVIILLSADLTQLRQALENKYIIDYEKILQHQGSMGAGNCQRMAEQYIEKVFPMVQQIHLPAIGTIINERKRQLTIAYYGQRDEKDNLLEFTGSNGKLVEEYQKVLLRLIYEKTGLIIGEREYLFELLPQKMRELTHFLEYMCSISANDRFSWADCLRFYFCKKTGDVDEKEKENLENRVRNWYDNLKRLEEYFGVYWCPMNLNMKQQKVIESIRDASAGDKNRWICMILNEYFKECFGEKGKWSNIFELEKDIRKIRENNSDEKYRSERKFLVFLSVYISMHRSEMVIYDLLNDGYLQYLEDIFQEEYVNFVLATKKVKMFKSRNRSILSEVSFDKFKIDEEEFRKIMKMEIPENDTAGGISKYAENYLIYSNNGKTTFNIFAPLTNCLKKTGDFLKEPKEIYSSNEENDSRDPFMQTGSVMQIVVNMELRERIQSKLAELDFNSEKELIILTKVMHNVYETIDQCVRDLTYLDIKSNTASLIADATYQNPVVNAAVLCNENLKRYYFDGLKSELISKIPKQIDEIKMGDGEGKFLEFFEKAGATHSSAEIRIEQFGLDEIMFTNEKFNKLFEVWNEYNGEMTAFMDGIRKKVVDLNTEAEKLEDEAQGLDYIFEKADPKGNSHGKKVCR